MGGEVGIRGGRREIVFGVQTKHFQFFCHENDEERYPKGQKSRTVIPNVGASTTGGQFNNPKGAVQNFRLKKAVFNSLFHFV